MPTATAEKKSDVIVSPWGIEIDHPRNCDVLIKNLHRVRLRGAVKSTRMVYDKKEKDYVIPQDQARELSAFPPVPGMQLHVNPTNLKYSIIDPLYENEELCKRIYRQLKAMGRVGLGTVVEGVEPQEGTIDIHEMKSLCIEMHDLVSAGEARVVAGVLPEREDIDDLPGYELTNPGLESFTTQPRYKKDWDQWIANMR